MNNVYNEALVAMARTGHGAQRLNEPHATVRIDNPLCGDEITLDLNYANGAVQVIGHRVRGCVLCEAAAAWLSLHAPGRNAHEVLALLPAVQTMLIIGEPASDEWPATEMFLPVHAAKSRYRCVLLPIEALVEATKQCQSST